MASNDIVTLIKYHNITDIASDAQSLQAGQMFFALRGMKYNGNDFIDIALSRGAGLVVTDILPQRSSDKIVIVEDIKLALQQALDYLYPNSPQYLVAVTGTNGKTSVVNYFQQLCTLVRLSAASIGTLGIITSDKELNSKLNANYSTNQTTMGLIKTRKILHQLAAHGIDFVALEASSQGISQERLQNIKFKAAAFTNFGHDHLDYHQDSDSYLDAKLKLFKENVEVLTPVIAESSTINDMPQIKAKIVDEYGLKLATVGDQGTITILNAESSLNEQKVLFKYNDEHYSFVVPIICKFQLINIFMALLLAINIGIDATKLISVLHMLQPIEGRLQCVRYANRYIFIDYAHNPDGLQVMLKDLKSALPKNARLILIFGGGGQRDKHKRSIMGKIAAKFVDLVIVTDDNPRNEDASSIRKEILRAVPSAIEIAHREEAIKYGIASMMENDILVISGRGHEKYQIVGDRKINFKDVEKVEFYMQQIYGKSKK